MDVNMDFFERVKNCCKAKGVTVRQFIESLGMNYDSYNGLKRYDNFPRLDEAMKIAEGLDTSVYYLFSGVDYVPGLSNEEMQFLAHFRKLGSHSQKNILELISQLAQINPIATFYDGMSDEEREQEERKWENYKNHNEN